jgi:uncharacterized RDD family membrane protein YckC
MENETEQKEYTYAGFCIRTGASIIDGILFSMIVIPIMIMVYGLDQVLIEYGLNLNQELYSEEFFLGSVDFLLNIILPILGTVFFWVHKSATPGKIILGLKVVDEETGNKLTVKQSFKRYFSFLIYVFPIFIVLIPSVNENQMDIASATSFIIILIGIIFLVWNKKKQGLHDKLAKTVVIRYEKRTEYVKFTQ